MHASSLLALLLTLSPLFLLAQSSPLHFPRSPHARSVRMIRSRRDQTSLSPFTHSTSKVALTHLSREGTSDGVPAQVLLQQHINKSLRRHARMTKRSVPSVEDLRKRIVKRWETLDVGSLQKRQRAGMALAGSEPNVGRVLQGGKEGRPVLPVGVGAKGQSVTMPVGNSTVVAGEGFSQTELDAAQANTVTPATTPSGTQSVGLSIEANDVGYFATIQIGTPATNFRILMDSGSADFWVPSTMCKTCGNHTLLGPATSSSFVAGTKPFQVTYGTGNVAGMINQDDVTIAGLMIKGHSFGATTTESVDFSDNSIPFDGLMGLAKGILSEQGVPTPIESLAQAGTVPAAQMGYHLARLSDGPNDGEVTFGGVDSTKFTGSLTEFPNVNKQGFWEGLMDTVSVNGISLGLTGRTAILDTGTTLIVAPPADAVAIHAAIPGSASDGQGGFTVPCTTTASLALTFGGTTFSIKPSDLAFLPVTSDLRGECTSGISSGTIGGPNEWLVGDVFLKNVYFATDVTSNSIGLAPSIHA